MLLVPARDGAQAVGREELRLVEELLEDPEHARHSDDPQEQPSLAGVTRDGVRDAKHVGGLLVHGLGPLDDRLVDGDDAEEREHPHDRAHLDRLGAPVRRRSWS